MNRPIVALVSMILVSSSLLAQPALPPGELLDYYMKTPMLTQSEGKMTGELMAWHAAWGMERFPRLARQTGDEGYVEGGLTYFNALLDKTFEAPDGYRGWVGTYIYDKNYIADHHIADAILVSPMLGLAEYILKEAPEEIRMRHSEDAWRLVRYAEKHVVEKWLARGSWWDDGRFGGFHYWDHFYSPETGCWEHRPDVNYAGYGTPFNKNMKLGLVLLRLYRITGSAEYLDRAEIIFNTFKSRLDLFKDSYTWNYWEPVYPGDVLSINPPRLTHWVATHAHRDYQEGELEDIVEAFHTGVTFTQDDIRRFVTTNLMMWNGSFDDPDFVNSNYAVNKAVNPEYVEPPPSPAYGGPAGIAWRALAEFSEPIARLTGLKADNHAIQRRSVQQPVKEFNFPHASSRMLSMVFAMPSIVDHGQEVTLGSKLRIPGHLQVFLLSAASGEVIYTLAESDVDQTDADGCLHLLSWPADVPSGDYLIRWQVNQDYRDYPLTVR